MSVVTLHIDGEEVQTNRNDTILEAAQKANIYIPSICHHPDLPPFKETEAEKSVYRGKTVHLEGCADVKPKGCGLCLVEIEGRHDLALACDTIVQEAMKVATNTSNVQRARKERLARILAKHPHACLTCAQKEGCSREPCSLNVPLDERCCDKLGDCELEKVAEYIGIKEDTPRYVPAGLPIIKDAPLFLLNYNLCINCTRCVRACQNLRGVCALEITCKEDETFVGTKASTLIGSGCRFCGACVEVCPTGALMDKNQKTVKHEEKTVPCVSACPVDIDIPSYVRLIGEGKFEEADAVIREKTPFPRVLGYVCHHPCEDLCRRSELNAPVAICALKRFASEKSMKSWKRESKKVMPTRKKVAVLGSGPAGLTASYYLAKKGHSVTVFEAMSELGGMLRMGILSYRLPNSILQQDIDEILELGIEKKTGTKIESTDAFKKLSEDYDAVFIGVGTQNSRKLDIEGIELKGVWYGLDFLREVNCNQEVRVGNKVIVVGGGNVAIDAARTALRLGAKTSILYRRSKNEMPAEYVGVEEAEKEGVDFRFLLAPLKILGKEGHVNGVKCIQMRLGEPDETDRRRPIPIEGEESIIKASTVIVAIGEKPDLSFLPKNVKLTMKGTLHTDPSTMETSVAGVFAGGDVASGPESVINAVAAGRKAAVSIDKYLGGDGKIDEPFIQKTTPKACLGKIENFADKNRVPVRCLPTEISCRDFTLTSLGYTEKEAVEEAKRCLQCDLRLAITSPPTPPEKWLEFEESIVKSVPETEGVYQFLDENDEIIYIKGTIDLRKELQDQLTTNHEANRFIYEEAGMFTTRESELLQQFLKKNGRLPRQNVDVDDLY